MKERQRCVIGCRSVLFQSCRVTRSPGLGRQASVAVGDLNLEGPAHSTSPSRLNFTSTTSLSLTYPHLAGAVRYERRDDRWNRHTQDKVLYSSTRSLDHERTQSSFTIEEPVTPPALSVDFAIPSSSYHTKGKVFTSHTPWLASQQVLFALSSFTHLLSLFDLGQVTQAPSQRALLVYTFITVAGFPLSSLHARPLCCSCRVCYRIHVIARARETC